MQNVLACRSTSNVHPIFDQIIRSIMPAPRPVIEIGWSAMNATAPAGAKDDQP